MEHKPHIAILPSPGMGHLIPFIALAKRLVQCHKFNVTCIIPTIGPPTKAVTNLLQTLPSSINHVYLPPVTFEQEEEESIGTETQLFLAIPRSLPALRKSLSSITNLSVLLIDPFGTDAFEVAAEFHIPCYIFWAANAMMLAFSYYVPKLDEIVPASLEYKDLSEPIKAPGCIPFHGRDLMDPLQDRRSGVYKGMMEIMKRLSLADGVIINSFIDLEEEPLKALQESKTPIYPVGPLIQRGEAIGSDDENHCLKWLDEQPNGSVLFVSFGSGGTLSQNQITELALGLEQSGQKFLWVLRSPSDESASSAYFSAQSESNPLDFLPHGFLERTKEQGLVVSSWAPQVQVLGHESTGGFLSHCGWNSSLESIVHGVPLIAWPLYAEQKMNAVQLSEDIKVALRVKMNSNGIVEREEVARVVNELMEGEEGKKVSKRVKELKEAAVKVLDENGSSSKALAELALKWNKG